MIINLEIAPKQIGTKSCTPSWSLGPLSADERASKMTIFKLNRIKTRDMHVIMLLRDEWDNE